MTFERNELFDMISSRRFSGITTDIDDFNGKLLVLTKNEALRSLEKLQTLPKSATVFSEEILPECLPFKKAYSEDFRRDFALLSKLFYNNVSDKMKFVFVTGTNGKTSTTNFIRQILEKAGERVCLIGTEGFFYKDCEEYFSMTTPDPHILHGMLDKAYKIGARTVVMEASAHAIALKKLSGICANVATLTNIERDHLDFFKTTEAYEAAKRALFTKDCAKKIAIPQKYEYFAENYDKNDVYMYSPTFCDGLTYFVKKTLPSLYSEYIYGRRRMIVEHKNLVGAFNAENVAAAILSCLAYGLPEEDVFSWLSSLTPPCGRAENVKNALGINVVIDFAHTPSALENVLKAFRGRGRVICVFGAGGDRDKGKRRLMGNVAGRFADLSFITSDNPRSEDPLSIIADIAKGVEDVGGSYEAVEDRANAVYLSIKTARKGDTIVIAGKGAEKTVEINGKLLPYSDKETVQRILFS